MAVMERATVGLLVSADLERATEDLQVSLVTYLVMEVLVMKEKEVMVAKFMDQKVMDQVGKWELGEKDMELQDMVFLDLDMEEVGGMVVMDWAIA